MPKTNKVTRGDIMVAQLIVKRAERRFGHTSAGVVEIANAKRRSEWAAERA